MACLKPGIGRRLIRGQHSHSQSGLSPSPSLSLVDPQHSNCPLLPNYATLSSHLLLICFFFFCFSRFKLQGGWAGCWLDKVEPMYFALPTTFETDSPSFSRSQ